MATIKLNIPDALEGVKFTAEQIRRFELSLLPEMAEAHALGICEKKFGIKFKLGKYNSEGFDVESVDGKIVVTTPAVFGINNSGPLSPTNVGLFACILPPPANVGIFAVGKAFDVPVSPSAELIILFMNISRNA